MKRRTRKKRGKRRRRSSRRIPCNKVMTSWRPSKKKVVRVCARGRSKIIHFGARGYRHNYSTKAKRSFRARHFCDRKNDIFGARHWACKVLWPKNKKGW